MRKIFWAVALSCAMWCLPAVAAPLDFKHVSASAKWLGHIDLDAMRDSVVVQKAMARLAEKHKHADAHCKMVEGLIGMNPKKDLHGATFYGPQVGKHEGVMVLHARMNQQRISAWAEKLPGREASEHNGHKISTWSKEHRGKKHTMSASWFGDEHLVIASGPEMLAAALDVLDGKADSLGGEGPLSGEVPKGAILMGRATDIDKAECCKKDPLAKQTKSVRFVVGEKDGQSFKRFRAEYTNTEVVGSLKEIVEGAQALLRIHCNGNEQGLRLVNALQINPDGATLTLLWKGSANDVWDMAEFHAQILEKHLAKMREHHRKHGSDKGKKCPVCEKGDCDKCDSCDKCKKGEKCEKCEKGGKKESKSKPKSDDEQI